MVLIYLGLALLVGSAVAGWRGAAIAGIAYGIGGVSALSTRR